MTTSTTTIIIIIIKATILFNSRVLAVSQDSVVVHERFANLNPGYGGVFDINFPLMEDKGGDISRLYGVDKAQAGHSYRAYFIIDPSQVRSKYMHSFYLSDIESCYRLCALEWWAIFPWLLGWTR